MLSRIQNPTHAFPNMKIECRSRKVAEAGKSLQIRKSEHHIPTKSIRSSKSSLILDYWDGRSNTEALVMQQQPAQQLGAEPTLNK